MTVAESPATRLRRDEAVQTPAAGTVLSLQGLATMPRTGNQVMVNGTSVTLNNDTRLEDGQINATVGDLAGQAGGNIAVGDRVLVTGVADGNDGIAATSLSIVRVANRFDIEGPIQDINVPLNRLVVDGLFIDLTESTLLVNASATEVTPLAIDALVVGQSVRVQGNRTTPQRITALRITRQN